MSTVELERLLVRIVGDASSYISSLRVAQTSTMSAVHRMTQMGRSMTYLLTAPIVAFGQASFKAFATFETSLSRIEGLVGVPKERVEEFSEAVLSMAGEIGKSPLELAEALYFVTSSGISAEHSMDILTASARASVAGLASTQVIADVVTSAINAYGIANLSAAQATDILIATIQEGKAEGPQLARTLGRVLPSAAALGVEFHEVGAALAAMTRIAGAEIAVTQLRGILSTIIGPTEQAKAALARANVGLTFEDIRRMVSEQGLMATMMRLKEIFPNINTMEQVFGNVRAMTGVLQLTGNQANRNAGIFARMRNTLGATDRAFEAAMRTSGQKWKQAMAEVEVGMILMGRVLAPVADFISATIRKLAREWGKLSDQTKGIVAIFASLVAVIGPVLLLLGYIGPTFLLGFTAIGQITGKIIAIAAIIGRYGMLATIFGAIVTWLPAILGVAGAVLLFVAYMGGFEEAWQAVKDAGLLAMVVFEGIKRGLIGLGAIIRDLSVIGWGLFVNFFSENRAIFDRVLTTVFVVGLLVVAFKMLIAAVVMTSAVLGALRVYQGIMLLTYASMIFMIGRTILIIYVFNASLMLVKATIAVYNLVVGAMLIMSSFWKAVTLVMTISMIALAVAITLVSGSILPVIVGIAAIGAVVLVAKAALWLFNTALTATNILLAVTNIVAAGVAFVAIAAIFATLSALAWGIVSAVGAVFIAFSSLWDVVGPIGQITSMFYEWWSIIQLVVRAARVDMPLAWEIMQAGFALAIAQIQALWPPLWEFIKSGFSTIATLVADVFAIEFKRALFVMLRGLVSMYQHPAIRWMLPSAVQALGTGTLTYIDAQIAALRNSRDMAANQAEFDLTAASQLFAANNFETPEVIAARERLAALQARLVDIETARAAIGVAGGGAAMGAFAAMANQQAADPAATARGALQMMGGAAGMAAAQMAGIEVMTPDEAEEARIRAEMAELGATIGNDLGDSTNEAAKNKLKELSGIIVGSLEDILVMREYRNLLAEIRSGAAQAVQSRAQAAGAVAGGGAAGAAAAAAGAAAGGEAGAGAGGVPGVAEPQIGAQLVTYAAQEMTERAVMIGLMRTMVQHLGILSARAGGEIIAADFG